MTPSPESLAAKERELDLELARVRRLAEAFTPRCCPENSLQTFGRWWKHFWKEPSKYS